MAAGYQSLTKKEKQTLRLIVRGHDAKSLARHLGLSIHTVNERLRDARRKLEVPSSRAAARLLLDTENQHPQNVADKQIGEAPPPGDVEQASASAPDLKRADRLAVAIAGVFIMSLILGLLALSLSSDAAGPSTAAARSPTKASSALSESGVVHSARDWLVLGDQGRWKDGWAATASSFRQLNTVEQWTQVADKVRVPLGAVVSRTALSQESIPAPPAGVEVVKFRTSFVNKANVIETVSLAREGSDWRVVGIYVE